MDPIHLTKSDYGAASKSGYIRTGDIVSIVGLEGKELLKAKNQFNTLVFVRYGGLDLQEIDSQYTNFTKEKCIIGSIVTKPQDKLPPKVTFFETQTDMVKVEQMIGVNRYVFLLSPTNYEPIRLARVEAYNFLPSSESSFSDNYHYQEIRKDFTTGSGYSADGPGFRNMVLQHPSSADDDNVLDVLDVLDDALYAIQLCNVKKMKDITNSLRLGSPIEDIVRTKSEYDGLTSFNSHLEVLKSIVCLKPGHTNFLNKQKRGLFKYILGEEPPYPPS